jgi:hypothetical protein
MILGGDICDLKSIGQKADFIHAHACISFNF